MYPHLVYFVQFWSSLCPNTSKNKIEPQKSQKKAKKVNKNGENTNVFHMRSDLID